MVAPRLRKDTSIYVNKTTVAGVVGALGISWLLVFYLFLGTVGDNNSVRGLAGFAAGAAPVYGILEKIASTDGKRHTEVVYSLPSSPDQIKATVLLLHGCNHHGRKFFSASPTCQTCVGLSEELRIARILQEQKSLAVISVTANDRKSGCYGDHDFDHVRDVLEHFRKEHQVSGPVLALGTSSGGRFGIQLAVRKIADAALSGVMSAGPELAQKWIALDPKPPVYFAIMPQDPVEVKKTEDDLEVMNGQGPVLLDKETCVPRPIDASYLNDRVPKLSMASAQAIVADLIEAGHIDPITGMLVKDPTANTGSEWKAVLKAHCGTRGCLEDQSLEVGESPLAKSLNRGWAFHEYCSEVTLMALRFFEKELGGSPFLPA